VMGPQTKPGSESKMTQCGEEADPQVRASLLGVAFAYPDGGGALEGIDLEVRTGGRLALVGPNGAGKTTVLRLLAGQIAPSRGTVRIENLNPATADRRELAKRVAVVSAQALVGFPYSVEEVVLMGRAPHVDGFRLESGRDLEVAEQSMAAMDVSQLAHRVFDSLSSGEKQRVAVARALAQEPKVLLLDEPGAFLDIRHQVDLYDLLSERAKTEGLTVISVLHDLNLAALYFDTVAMVAGGTIYAQGAADDVITYANVRAVFETDVYVDRNDLTGKLNVLPLPASVLRKQDAN
jgi:iron complex transport system ATP-binding protein